MATVEIRDIHKFFGDQHVIKGIDLTIGDGEFVVFVGPSGCGKSTMLRLISGLEEATAGQIVIDGRDVTGLGASERGLAMVFQSYALYPHMTVRENMGFGLKLAGKPKQEINKEVNHAAEILQLEPLLDRKPKEMSGGQRQRVAIGRAIVRAPAVFLFDEPLSNLDAALRVQMRIEIARLHKRLSKTMVYVTHDQIEAMTLADRIVVMDDGHIQQEGSPLDLYSSPSNLFVATFIGSPKMNVLPCSQNGVELSATLAGGSVVTAEADSHTDKPATSYGIRPEHIAVVEPSAGDLRGDVGVVEQLGGDTFIYVDVDGAEPITVRIPGIARIREGDVVGLKLDAQQAHFFDADGLAVTARRSIALN
ncbi:MAG: ABC transporter ATP-binding protein [Alphaproteobacteria bacterium]